MVGSGNVLGDDSEDGLLDGLALGQFILLWRDFLTRDLGRGFDRTFNADLSTELQSPEVGVSPAPSLQLWGQGLDAPGSPIWIISSVYR